MLIPDRFDGKSRDCGAHVDGKVEPCLVALEPETLVMLPPSRRRFSVHAIHHRLLNHALKGIKTDCPPFRFSQYSL